MREFSAEHARRVLSAEGFSVSDIPERDGENRADLLVQFESEEYVVEAKLKEAHQGWIELEARASATGFASVSRNVDPWNAISSRLRKAYRQLTATPASEGAFRVLWLIAPHDDGAFVAECLTKRLIGHHLMVVMGDALGDPISTRQCFFYDSNEFEHFRELHAAVVGTATGAQLLVNTRNPDAPRFRSTKLFDMFAKHRAVIDPDEQHASGEAFVVGSDFAGPRSGKSLHAYLLRRYGKRASAMMEVQFSGMAVLSLKDGEPTEGG
jgi:hypothetical protein